MSPTKQQAQRIYRLCKYDKKLKEALVAKFTGSDTRKSCYDLTHAQANELIVHLGGLPIGKKCWGSFNMHDQKHKYILSLLHQLGWTTTNSSMRLIPDIERFGKWLESDKAPVRKPLLQQKPASLSKTIYALEQMVIKTYTSEGKANRQPSHA